MNAFSLTAETRIFYQWMRFEQLDQWWHWLLVIGLSVAVLSFVVWMYRRDSVEQMRPVRWALLLLRLAAFVGLLLFFFQFDKRSEQRITRNSRVAVLVDTSLSMTLPGTPSASGLPSQLTRTEEAANLLARTPVTAELAARHDVSVYRFDQAARPQQVAAMTKTDKSIQEDTTGSGAELATLRQSHVLMLAACAIGAAALLLILVSLFAQISGARTWQPGGWCLLSGSISALIAMIVLAWAILPVGDYSLSELLLDPETAIAAHAAEKNPSEPIKSVMSADGTKSDGNQPANVTRLPDDWNEALIATGIETRMGDAIKAVLEREQGSPLASIVVITDGRSNAGLDPKSLLLSLQNARVPLTIVGLGSELSPPNVKLVEIDAPKRVYPGDKFVMNTLIQNVGFNGQTVTLQVTSGPRSADPASYSIEAEEAVTLGDEDSLTTATFELTPKAVGEWVYQVKVLAPAGDADAGDNQSSATIEVIERKNRILIFAGGPTREYQFVRNLLFRDRDTESHVLLQSGRAGMSQEAQKIITEFPADRAALSQYDAILAFDADWTKVSDAQMQALEQWVAEQAGGLMLIAGSVEMPKWMARSAGGERAAILRSLSPVRLDERGSRLLAGGRVESDKAWPLKISPDGAQIDFMWLSDDPQTSSRLWDAFEGVYTFESAYELKPGGKALAYFNDPTAAVDGNLPIYLASQFYGAGRVVYQGGGEMWRLRELGDLYFDRYFTKLVRWLAQGRLMLDSDRGILLVDREQALLGDQVAVRAVLKDARFQPLIQSEVIARLLDPQKRNSPLVLKPLPDGSQPGVYTGQFPVQTAGEYTLLLQLGGLSSEEVLTTTVKARVPAVEMQRAERNDALLAPLAAQSGGRYFRGAEEALVATVPDNITADSTAVDKATGSEPITALAAAITPQDQTSFLPGVPDRNFQLRWLAWLMALIAGSLTIEWFARRLHRLA
ncbi:MAG: hypothetical protein U0892_23085 [Pirellulales bacterium]